jgi:hypothetical protein
MTDAGPPAGVRPPAPDPAFEVLGAEPVAHAAAPTLRFTLRVTDEGTLHAIALSAQINIDPARRRYDDATRERLVELFGPPERGGAPSGAFQWGKVECLVPSFTGSAEFALELPCTYDLEVTSAKYMHALDGGEVPLIFHFNGTILYAGENDRLQIALVPWSCSVPWRMPVAVWKRTVAAHYPGGGWIRVQEDTLEELQHRKAQSGAYSFDEVVRGLFS